MEKAGWKTTEFWLSTITMVIGLVLASGAVVEGSLVSQILGGGMSLLASMGYTFARSGVKKSAAVADAIATAESTQEGA